VIDWIIKRIKGDKKLRLMQVLEYFLLLYRVFLNYFYLIYPNILIYPNNIKNTIRLVGAMGTRSSDPSSPTVQGWSS
jgi:hypothetical protein